MEPGLEGVLQELTRGALGQGEAGDLRVRQAACRPARSQSLSHQ